MVDAIERKYKEHGSRRPATELEHNDHVNEMLQKYTNVEQLTQDTQARQRRLKRTEKRKQLEVRGYLSSSGTDNERTFLAGDELKLLPGSSTRRTGSRKRTGSPKLL